MHRTIPTKHNANSGKQHAIIALLPHWQQALQHYIHILHANTLAGNPTPKYAPKTPTLQSQLTARHLASNYNQAKANYTSHIALLQERIKTTITHSTLNRNTKEILHRINARQA